MAALAVNRKATGTAQWVGFFLWAVVAANFVSWSGEILAGVSPVPPYAKVPGRSVAINTPMVRLFGHPAPLQRHETPPVEAERFQLLGVIDPGFALVAVDGGTARTWSTGSKIDGNTALLSVSKRAAEFGQPGGPAAFSLHLPEPGTAERQIANPSGSIAAHAGTAISSSEDEPPPRKRERRHLKRPHLPHRRGAQGDGTPAEAADEEATDNDPSE